MKLVRAVGQLLQGSTPCLSVLIFHRVLPTPDPLFPEEPDARRFEALLRTVSRCFNVIPLAEAVRGLREGGLPHGALSITFDDGYADNQQVAVPVLNKLGLPATFFVASGFLDGGRMWNDTVVESVRRTRLERLDLEALGLGVHALGSTLQRRQAIDRLLRAIKHLPPGQRQQRVEQIASRCGAVLPDDLMMSSEQLRQLHAAGMEVGGHTMSHPILCSVPDDVAQGEMAENKRHLEQLLQVPMRLFAYPNGKPGSDFAARHAGLARALGYEAAVTTAPGVARPGADLMQLPRFTPWDRSERRFAWRLLANMRQPLQLAA